MYLISSLDHDCSHCTPDNKHFALSIIYFIICEPMFEHDNSLPADFGTPLRKKQKFAKIECEKERDYSQGRSSITKSSSVPSTIASPRLQATSQGLYFDIDLCSVMLEEEEISGRCLDYYQRGYCRKGEQCGEWHGLTLEAPRSSNWHLLTNFPQLVTIKGLLRVRSFLE